MTLKIVSKPTIHVLVAPMALFAAISLTGCLKTRAQLKESETDDAPAAKSAPATVKSVDSEGGYVIDELKAEITRLNGRIEDLERSQKEGGGKSEDNKKLETRVIELENAQAQMIEELKKIQAGKGAAPTAAEASDLYEKGKKQFEAKDFENSIQTLSTFLKAGKSKRTEDATLLRAEAYFSTKEYKKAILDYSKFPEKYPQSKHVPHALLRIGQSFEALGMKDDAKGFYQELNEKYPKSPEAKRAHAKGAKAKE